jgi:hypothetical protein
MWYKIYTSWFYLLDVISLKCGKILMTTSLINTKSHWRILQINIRKYRRSNQKCRDNPEYWQHRVSYVFVFIFRSQMYLYIYISLSLRVYFNTVYKTLRSWNVQVSSEWRCLLLHLGRKQWTVFLEIITCLVVMTSVD